MGVGGSIPFIAEFLDTFPEASVLVTGVEDPDTRAHGANEGLHLAEFERVVVAEALLLRNLGAHRVDDGPAAHRGALPPLGIAGRGMAPLALAARHLGARSPGATVPDRWRPTLAAAAGLHYDRDHSEAHVGPGVTFVATSVAPSDDRRCCRAGRRGVWHRTDLLARLLEVATGRRRHRQPRQGHRGGARRGRLASRARPARHRRGHRP